ncbi:GtrA family protein [Streptosporangium sp. NPDC048047]|uniref:GtrA family protein n=1 Tax=Streptosporangium sp. NPDC048047 TaxID=3155748 RepID=UPI003412E6FF
MVRLESGADRDGNLPSRRRSLISALSHQRITYLLAGAVTAAAYYALLCLALAVTDDRVPYLFLAFASHAVTVLLVYPLFRAVVFRSSGQPWLTGLARFYTVGLGFMAASAVGLPILVEIAGIPIVAAQAMIIALSPPLSYVVHRTWTFSKRRTL